MAQGLDAEEIGLCNMKYSASGITSTDGFLDSLIPGQMVAFAIYY